MISIKNKNLWKFSSIPGIEESTFNKVLEKFYDLGISGLVRENVQNSLDGKLPGSNEPVIVTIKTGKINKELTDPMIVKYCELNQQYHYKINMKRIDNLRNDLLTNTQLKQSLLFNKISKEIKFELSKFGYSDSEISDILVKFLYHVKPSKHKSVLWFCYGEEIVKNLKKHFKPKTKFVQCIDCGEWFETDIKNKRTCRCDNCSIEHKRELTRLRVKKHRNK